MHFRPRPKPASGSTAGAVTVVGGSMDAVGEVVVGSMVVVVVAGSTAGTMVVEVHGSTAGESPAKHAKERERKIQNSNEAMKPEPLQFFASFGVFRGR